VSAATHLHVYRCSNCGTVATATVRSSSLLKCRLCFRLMAYQWSKAIATEEDRAIAALGVAFNPWRSGQAPALDTRKCSRTGCFHRAPDTDLIHLPGIGKFCSEDCAQRGQAEWDAFMARLRKLKEDRPWLTAQ
jgi:hypothetical protein